MTAYIEYVILDNLIIDFLLLSASLRSAGCKTSNPRLIMASILGTIFAVCMPFINLASPLFFVIKLIVGEAIVFVAGVYKTIGQFLRTYLFFLTYTFIFGGFLIGVGYMWKMDFSAHLGIANMYTIAKVPFIAVFFGIFIVVRLAYRLVFSAKRQGDKYPYLREVAICDCGQTTKLTGLIDTGNRLVDIKTGKPVSVINKSVADALILTGKLNLKGARFIPFNTVSGEGKIMVFEIDRLVIYFGEQRNIIDNAMVGISPYKTEGEDVILSADLIGEL